MSDLKNVLYSYGKQLDHFVQKEKVRIKDGGSNP